MGPCATPAQHLFRRLRDHPRMLPRVAIAEDDSDLRRALERGLAEEGFDVAAASYGGGGLPRGAEAVAGGPLVHNRLPGPPRRRLVPGGRGPRGRRPAG